MFCKVCFVQNCVSRRVDFPPRLKMFKVFRTNLVWQMTFFLLSFLFFSKKSKSSFQILCPRCSITYILDPWIRLRIDINHKIWDFRRTGKRMKVILIFKTQNAKSLRWRNYASIDLLLFLGFVEGLTKLFSWVVQLKHLMAKKDQLCFSQRCGSVTNVNDWQLRP